jgi:hypothetical protein
MRVPPHCGPAIPPLVSILRQISRDPHIGKFSLVAFNMQEQRILYRQESASRIDFPGLGEALNTIQLGTVDLKRLSQKNGETSFSTELIRTELGGSEHPDALIFAGPKVMLDGNIPQDTLREVGEVEYPVFYMNYNLSPTAMPWRDSISRAVRFLQRNRVHDQPPQRFVGCCERDGLAYRKIKAWTPSLGSVHAIAGVCTAGF